MPPVSTPVTIPVPEPTVATPGLALLHVPPLPELKEVVAPWHTLSVPVIAGGAAFTVTVWDAAHPVGNVYLISDVPPVMETPVTVPVVPEPATVADDVVTLLQVPPAVASDKVVVAPVQTVVVPLSTDAGLLTVTAAVLLVVPHVLITV